MVSVACLEIRSHERFEDDASSRELLHAQESQSPKKLAASWLKMGGLREGRGAGGRWDSDKRDGGHRTPAVEEIRGRGSRQRPGHIIHKPTLSHPNPPPTPAPPAPLSPLMRLFLEDGAPRTVSLSGALREFSGKSASSTFL